MPIKLVRYDPDWPAAYARARDEVLAALGEDSFVGIEHVGSTAVPGICAKPLIDMVGGVQDLAASEDMVEPLDRLGYRDDRAPSAPGRRTFERQARDGTPTEHLHVVEHGGANWVAPLRFRDWLRSHPEDREAYERLKRALASRYHATTDYSAAKTDFVLGILERAANAEAPDP